MTDATPSEKAPSEQEPSAADGSGRHAWGYGLATVTDAGDVLDTWYPSPELGEAPGMAGPRDVPIELAALQGPDPHRQVTQTVVRTVIDLAPEVSQSHLERMVRDCLRRGLFTVEEARRRVAEPDMVGRRGAEALRRLL